MAVGKGYKTCSLRETWDRKKADSTCNYDGMYTWTRIATQNREKHMRPTKRPEGWHRRRRFNAAEYYARIGERKKYKKPEKPLLTTFGVIMVSSVFGTAYLC